MTTSKFAPSGISPAVAAVAAKVEKFRNRRIGEQNTKTSLIEPILSALGWDIHDPDEVFKEFKAERSDKPVDYALKLMREPRLLLEAKGLGENLSDRKWIAQVLGYAVVAGVEWCVLTDGDEYRFYNATVKLDAEEKLFCQVRLTQDDPEKVVRVLGLIARIQLEENILDQFWKAHYVDRQVKGALEHMVEEADHGLIRLVRRQAPELQPKQVAQSLRRLDIRIEAPPPSTGALRSEGRRAERKQVAGVARAKVPALVKVKGKRKAPTQIAVSLRDLIEAGTLQAPLMLKKKYKGEILAAKLLPSGAVEFGGEAFASCSTAAQAARHSVIGFDRPTNGWEFWTYESDGKARSLAKARADFLGQGQ